MSDKSELKETLYLFKGPFIMCILSKSVDKGIQSFRDDSAAVGRGIRVHVTLIILLRDTLCLERLIDKTPLTLWSPLV